MIIWRKISGFGRYEVSTDGRIRVIFKNKIKIMRTFYNNCGYPVVTLTPDEGKVKSVTIHRIMAKTFIPNPENKPLVNHKNGKKYDNRIENLEWMTKSENSQHAYDTGLRVAPRPWLGKSGSKHHRSLPVEQYDISMNLIAVHESRNIASIKTGVYTSNIYKCLVGIRKTAGGFIWKSA